MSFIDFSFLFRSLRFTLLCLSLIALQKTTNAAKVPAPSCDQSVETLKEEVAYILSLSKNEIRDLVPTKSYGIWHTACPNCHSGFEDRGRFEWLPQEPMNLRCEVCGEVYPDNPKYPDNKSVSVKGPGGRESFFYWEDSTGYRYFFRAHADYLMRLYLGKQIQYLACLYAETGEEIYAEPAAILLQRFSEVVPGYAFALDLPFHQKQFHAATDDRVRGSRLYGPSIWSLWTEHDVLGQFLAGYTALNDWSGWEELEPKNARQAIEDDLIGYLVDFVLTFDDPLTSVSPRIWKNAIHAGRLLDRPKWVHEGIDRFGDMLEKRFLHDGFWHETSPSAHANILKELSAVREIATGYSDPEGFESGNSDRFDDLDLPREFPLYRLALEAREQIRLPSGRLIPLNRTWAIPPMAREEEGSPRKSSESFLLPGLGLAILATGEGNEQFFSWLDFTWGEKDKHRSALSIGLFGYDREVLSDIGATNTRLREAWAASTMSHNTVVVNGQEQALDENQSGNRVIAFANGRRFHMAAVENDSAYPGITEKYRRTLILVGSEAGDAYLLDVFEIKGGKRHDYLLHGDSDFESTIKIEGTPLEPFRGTLVNPGVTFQQPETPEDDMGKEGAFSFIQNLQIGNAREPLRIDFRLSNDSRKGHRTIFAPISDVEIFTGNSPAIRPAEENDAELAHYSRPSFVARREGTNLNSVFVAAHEPINGFPRLHDIRTRFADDRIWISIRHAGGRDYLSILRSDNPPDSATFNTSKGEFTTDGTYSIVRLDRQDAVVSAHLVEGKKLEFRNFHLDGSGQFKGTIKQMLGGEAGKTAFEIAERISPKIADTLIVGLPDGSSRAYSVTRVEPSPGGTTVHVRESAGFTVEKNEILIKVPERTIEGTAMTYRLIVATNSE